MPTLPTMEWTEGRITKRSEDVAKAPEHTDATTKRAYIRADEPELASARKKILELKYEIEALKGELSVSHVERLNAELSISYATNRGVRAENEKLNAELRHERQENEKLNGELKHERQEDEKLNAELRHEKQENERLIGRLKREREEKEKLDAGLKLALLANGNLIELSRSQRDQADGFRAILEIVADRLERWPCPLRFPEPTEGDDVRQRQSRDLDAQADCFPHRGLNGDHRRLRQR
jgi:hypothetical protein